MSEVIARKRLVVFCPSRVYGGTELLLARASSAVASILSSDLAIVDEQCGIVSGILDDASVPHDFMDVNDHGAIATTLEYAFFSSKDVVQFLEWCNRRQVFVRKLIIWQLHPEELISAFIPFSFHVKSSSRLLRHVYFDVALDKRMDQLSSAIRQLLGHQGLLFMDGECFDTTMQWLKLDCPVRRFVPIFVDDSSFDFSRNGCADFVFSSDELRVSYLGRVSADFKFFPLVSAIDNIVKWAQLRDKRVRFDIIGDGDRLGALDSYLAGIVSVSERITYRLLGRVELNDALSFIRGNSDLVLAMGTAVINGGSCGKPSILLDAYNFKVDSGIVLYRWIFESDEYAVGRSIANQTQFTGRKMEALLDEHTLNPQELALRCYSYCEENHSTSTCAQHLVTALLASNLDSLTLSRLLQPVLLSRRRLVAILRLLSSAIKRWFIR